MKHVTRKSKSRAGPPAPHRQIPPDDADDDPPMRPASATSRPAAGAVDDDEPSPRPRPETEQQQHRPAAQAAKAEAQAVGYGGETRRADEGLAEAMIRKFLYLNLWMDKERLKQNFLRCLPPEFGSRRNLARKKPYATVQMFNQVCFEQCLRDMERGGEVELRRIDMPPKDELRGDSCWQARLTEKGFRKKLIESRLQPAEPASLSENTSLQEDIVLRLLLNSQNTIPGLRSLLKDARLTVDAALTKCGSGETDIYEFDEMESRLEYIEATVLTLVDSFTFRVGGALVARGEGTHPAFRLVSSKQPSGLTEFPRHNNPWWY